MKIIQKKICLLGGFAVGKTSLVRRFIEERFDDKYLSTIGVKISRKSIQRDDCLLKLLIWDLAGGEDFSAYESSYLQGAAGALIVYDLVRPDTIEEVVTYADSLRGSNPGARIVVAANKIDLVEERAAAEAELLTLARQLEAPVFLTSAKSGENVQACLTALAELTLQ